MTVEKDVADIGRRKDVEKKKEEMFEVGRTPLFYARAPGH